MAEEPTDTLSEGAGTGRGRLFAIVAAAALALVLIAGAIIALNARNVPTGTATDAPTTTASSSPSSGTTASAPTPNASADADASTPADPGGFPELPAVAPDQPASATGLTAALTKFEDVTGEVVGPGEVQAAAVRVTIQIQNTSASALDLNSVVVNAYIGADREPASTYEQPGGAPFSGTVAPGATATGVYLFRIPEDRRSDVTFTVDYSGGEPALTWRGAVVTG